MAFTTFLPSCAFLLCLCVYTAVSRSPIESNVNQCISVLECFSRVVNINLNNLVSLAATMDDMCTDILPKAEECVMDSGCDEVMGQVNALRSLCEDKEAVKEGMRCWQAGFDPQMRTCITMEMERVLGLEICRVMAGVKSCIIGWMSVVPECTPSEKQVVENMIDSARQCSTY